MRAPVPWFASPYRLLSKGKRRGEGRRLGQLGGIELAMAFFGAFFA